MAKKHPLPRPVPQFCDFNEKVPDLYIIWWVFPLPIFFLSEKFLGNVADKQPGKQAFKKPHLSHTPGSPFALNYHYSEKEDCQAHFCRDYN